MKKIFELTEKEFMTGIAPSSQVQNKGLWHKAKGITVIRDIFFASDTIGLLQAGQAPTDITSGVTDIPIACDSDITDDSNRKFYIWGKSGNLYSIDLATDGPATKLNGSDEGPSANGLFVMTHSTGDRRVWYFREGDIGYYNIVGGVGPVGSMHNAEYTADIETTPHHPTHRLFDRVYFGNGQYIGSAQDDGSSGLTIVGHALDFVSDIRVNCISDDGQYVVAGISKNRSTLNTVQGDSKVIFWDGNQDSWQREWPIPDAAIYSIKRVGAVMRAVTSRGIFDFTYSYPPTPMLPYLNSEDAPDYQYPTQFAAEVVGQAILFAGSGEEGRISSFGKLSPAMPSALMQPFAGFDGTPTMIAFAKTSTLFVGTSSSKLYAVSLSASGNPLTGVQAETIYIDLSRWWQVSRIIVEFASALVDGDEISISVASDPDTSESFGQASFLLNGAIRTKEMFGSFEARKLKLITAFTGGAVKIRSIQGWGDPLETPTHV
jgi:hypothetical protein